MTKLIIRVQSYLATRQDDEEGASMVEYGLLVAGIAVVVGGAAVLLGGRIETLFDGVIPGG